MPAKLKLQLKPESGEEGGDRGDIGGDGGNGFHDTDWCARPIEYIGWRVRGGGFGGGRLVATHPSGGLIAGAALCFTALGDPCSGGGYRSCILRGAFGGGGPPSVTDEGAFTGVGAAGAWAVRTGQVLEQFEQQSKPTIQNGHLVDACPSCDFGAGDGASSLQVLWVDAKTVGDDEEALLLGCGPVFKDAGHV